MAKKPEQKAAVEESRASALDAFLHQQAKDHPNEVMRLNDSPRVNIEVVPTGAISLDVAIGAGGFPRGKIVELYGGEGGGKCLPAGTYLWTDLGLETIEELFARCGQKASNTSRITDIAGRGVMAVNELGELEEIAALTHNYTRPTWRVTSESGRFVEATAKHPLRVLDDDGYIVWRKVSDIKEGDVLVSALFGAKEARGGSGISIDEAVLLGYLAAEGSLGQKYNFNFTNWDPEVHGEYMSLVASVLGAPVVNYYDREFRVSGKSFREHMQKEYGLEYVNADGKTVPYCIRTAGVDAQRAFLSALYEGDGWFTNNSVGLASASKSLIEQVHLMLLGMGIPATMSVKWNKEYERNYWSLLISSAASSRFMEQVGFRSKRRAALVAKNTRVTDREPWSECIPNMYPLVDKLVKMVGGDRAVGKLMADLRRTDLNTRGSVDAARWRLNAIVDWAESKNPPAAARRVAEHLRELADSRYTYERVVSVEDAGKQPTFDISVPGTSSFIANGICSHNTTVALTVAKNVQRLGGNVGFIDAEHGLNKALADGIGIDPNRFVIYQPDSGEQAIDMVEQMIRSKAFDMVIVDSIAAMTPQAEIDAEVDQAFMGLHARLMSRFMRRVAAPTSENGVMLVLVNQVRKNLGAYGTPDETTGGKAIKFYSSLRIEVRTSGSKKITRNGEVVGHTVTATIKKNRLGAPFTTAEFDIIYGHGVDASGSLLEVAEQLGVVIRSGAYYTEAATGERFSETDEDGKVRPVVGKDAVKVFLKENDETRNRIEATVYAALDSNRAAIIEEPDIIVEDGDLD